MAENDCNIPSDEIPSSHKRCSVCKKIKLLEDYFFLNKKRDSRRGYCKECDRDYRKRNAEHIKIILHEHYIKNMDRIKDSKKLYNERNRERIALVKKEWQEKNPEKVIEYKRNYQLRNSKTIVEEKREWRKRNRGKINISILKRKTLKKGLPHSFTEDDVEFSFQYWHGSCAVCRKENGMWHMICLDHFIPLVHPLCPGTIPGNMLPLCHAKKGMSLDMGRCCNNEKWTKDPVVWLTEKLGTRKANEKLKEIMTFFAAAKKFAGQEQAM